MNAKADLLDRMVDLHKQATTERSHHYVASILQEAIEEIARLRLSEADLRLALIRDIRTAGAARR